MPRSSCLFLVLVTSATGCFGDPEPGGGGTEGADTSTGGSPSSSATASASSTATLSGSASDTGSSSSSSDPTTDDSSTTVDPETTSSTGDSTSSTTSESTTTGDPIVCGDGVVEGDETCDDQNADELDGCLSDCRVGPVDLVLGDSEVTETAGMAGGATFDDACPAGEVLIGVRGNWSPYLRQMQAVCGTIVLQDLGGLTVTVGENTVLDLRGSVAGDTEYDATCPADHAVVGFGGYDGLVIDQLTIHCAPVELTDDGTFISVGTGDVVELQTVGGDGGEEFDDITCSDGYVATVANIRAGNAIDSFGLTCQELLIVYP